MSEGPQISFGTKLAEQVIEAYAAYGPYIMVDKCRDLKIGDRGCSALCDVLGDGIITEVEQRALEVDDGFSKDFVRALAGDDGKKALKARVRWLSDHAVKKWWRIDASEKDRAEMIEEIGEYGPDARDAVPVFLEALDHGNPVLQRQAAWVLGRIHPDDDRVVPALIRALNNSDLDVHRLAIEALGNFGPDAKDAVPALMKILLGRSYRYVHIYKVRDAIAKIGSAAVPALLAALVNIYKRDGLFDSSHYTCQNIYFILTTIGKAAVPVMIESLKNVDVMVRLVTVFELARIGKSARIAIPHLENMERNDLNPDCREAAKEAREKIEAEIL